MKKILLTCATLCLVLLLGWCSSKKEVNMQDCFTKLTGDVAEKDSRTICVEDVLMSVKNDFVKTCAEKNIAAKTGLVETLKANQATSGDLKDIDNLVKECIAYDLEYTWDVATWQTTASATSAWGYPIFNSFVYWYPGMYVPMFYPYPLFVGYGFNYNSVDSDFRRNYNNARTRAGRPSSYAGAAKANYSPAKSTATSSSYNLGSAGKSWSSTATSSSRSSASSSSSSSSSRSSSSSATSSSLW